MAWKLTIDQAALMEKEACIAVAEAGRKRRLSSAQLTIPKSRSHRLSADPQSVLPVLLLAVLSLHAAEAFASIGPPIPLFGDGPSKIFSSVPVFVHASYRRPVIGNDGTVGKPTAVTTAAVTAIVPTSSQAVHGAATAPSIGVTSLEKRESLTSNSGQVPPTSVPSEKFVTVPKTDGKPTIPPGDGATTGMNNAGAETTQLTYAAEHAATTKNTQPVSATPPKVEESIRTARADGSISPSLEARTSSYSTLSMGPHEGGNTPQHRTIPEEPDSVLRPNDRGGGAVESPVTPAMTRLKTAQTNESGQPQILNTTQTKTPTLNPSTDPSAATALIPTSLEIPGMIHSSQDMIKWLILAAALAILLAVVSVFFVCLRSVDNRKNRKLHEILYQTGLAYPGDELDGPTNYMDIQPCSPLATQWRSRGFSFGSQSHLQNMSARGTPLGTLKNSRKSSRRRSSSAPSSVLAKWKSIARHSGGNPDLGSATGNGSASCMCCMGDIAHTVHRNTPAQSSVAGTAQYCDCADQQHADCDCAHCNGIGSCPSLLDGNCHHATIHANPLTNISLPSIPAQCNSARESVFFSPDCNGGVSCQHCGVRDSDGLPCCHCIPAYIDCPPWQPPGHSQDRVLPHDNAGTQRRCYDSIQRAQSSADELRSKRSSRAPTQEEYTDHLLSMLAQAHNLAKGMSLDRKRQRQESPPGAQQSGLSNTSTMSHRRTEFDESSGYIGSSPCVPSPTGALHQAVDVAAAHASPQPDEVAARLEECRKQQKQTDQNQRRKPPSVLNRRPPAEDQSRDFPDKTSARSSIPPPTPCSGYSHDSLPSSCGTPLSHQWNGSLERRRYTQQCVSHQQPPPLSPLQQPPVEARERRDALAVQACSQSRRHKLSPGPAGNSQSPAGNRQPGQFNLAQGTTGKPRSQRPVPPPKPKFPPPPPLRAGRGASDVLPSLSEKSKSVDEQPTVRRGTLQTPMQKSSSFWNGSGTLNEEAKPHWNPGQASAATTAHKASNMGAAKNSIMSEPRVVAPGPVLTDQNKRDSHYPRVVSTVSQDDSLCLGNPYNQVTWDYPLPPPAESLSLSADSQSQQGNPWAEQGCRSPPQGILQSGVAQPGYQDHQHHLGGPSAVNVLHAGRTPHKQDLSRQNTNSSSEEQNGNFYYLREGDQTLRPDLGSLDLPPLSDHVRRYLTGGSSLRQLSMLSADSLDAPHTTTL